MRGTGTGGALLAGARLALILRFFTMAAFVPSAEGQAAQPQAAFIVSLVRHQDPDQPLAIEGEIIPVQDAPALAATLLAERQQPAEPRIGRSVRGIDKDCDAVGQIEPGTDDQPDASRLRRLMGSHDPGQGIAVDDTERLDAAVRRLGEQLLAGGCPAEKLKWLVT